MRSLIKQGKSIILITHKLKEIKAIADRCTVIRRGKYIGTVEVGATSEAEMAKTMVGRPVTFKVAKGPSKPGKTILKVNNLSVLNNKKVLGLKNFSLEVRAGEIVGIAGVEGNGQTELVEAITGLRKMENGSVYIEDTDISHYSIRKRTLTGIGHIPEDRHKHGLVLDYTLEDNMILQVYFDEQFSKAGFLNRKAIHNYAKKIIDEFDVRSGEGAASMARSDRKSVV